MLRITADAPDLPTSRLQETKKAVCGPSQPRLPFLILFFVLLENALLRECVKSHVIPTTVKRARVVISARVGRRDLVLTILEVTDGCCP